MTVSAVVAALWLGLPMLAFVLAFVATVRGVLTMPALRKLDVPARDVWPKVTLITPACNEEVEIGAALRSVLAQQYPSLEVIAVNDRSTDSTGAILDALAKTDPRLGVVHITTLPDGWLGKLNALAKGVERSTGDWLLIADADVHLGPQTLQKTIAYADAHAIDFVSVMPEIASAGFLGDTVFNVVVSMFHLTTRPWNIHRADSKAIAATGAFMLVRRSAFARTPGFEWLRLEVADDFGLCLMIKTFGGKCELLAGHSEVKLTWYASAAEMAAKMQKNFYAITGRFSLARIVSQVAVLGVLATFPLAVLLAPPALNAPTWVAAALGLQVLNALIAARWAGRPLVPALFAPVGLFTLGWMMLRAGLIGQRQGGITWRGVLYPTALLREHQRVRF